MRSKRINVSGRGPDDEIDFVDGDLLPLTTQLSAEANQLATIYPPKPAARGDFPVAAADFRPRRRVPRSVSWVSIGAALALSVGLATSLLWITAGVFKDSAAGAWSPARPQPQTAARVATSPESVPAISPVMFVSELSDPELEAWLDLRTNADEERIAF